MISIDAQTVRPIIRKFKSEIVIHQSGIPNALQAVAPYATTPRLRRYLKMLINNADKLITGSLSDLHKLKADLDQIEILNSENDAAHQNFKDHILSALHYKDRRSDFYPKYFLTLGLKACVYCNSQLCVIAEEENGALTAKFQVDHHLPKGIYPGFSVWLLNLIPVCSSCNNKKGSHEIEFVLYTTKSKLGPSKYHFELLDQSKTVAAFITTRDLNLIKIKFNEPSSRSGKRSLNSLFAIQGIYETQADIVEEIILKQHIYDKSQKKDLLKNFGKLFNNSEKELERLIISNYVDEHTIHNRPLSKFTQDIARQLGLIK